MSRNVKTGSLRCPKVTTSRGDAPISPAVEGCRLGGRDFAAPFRRKAVPEPEPIMTGAGRAMRPSAFETPLRGPVARLLPVSAAGRRDAVRGGTTEPRRYAAGGRWRRERAMERSEGGVDLPRRCARRLGVVPPACAIMEAVPGQRRIARVQRAITRPMFASPPTRRAVPGAGSGFAGEAGGPDLAGRPLPQRRWR
jgi:hypothetical protein